MTTNFTRILFVMLLCFSRSVVVTAQEMVQKVTAVVGKTGATASGDGGPALQAKLFEPWGMDTGPDGAIYIADMGNSCIRKVDPAGNISTVVGIYGQGVQTEVEGKKATEVGIWYPQAVAVDPSGNIYFAMGTEAPIYKVDNVTKLISAVNPDIHVRATSLFYKSGYLYVVDNEMDRAFKIDLSTTNTMMLAGMGRTGDNTMAVTASLADPYDITVDGDGNIYIAEYGGNLAGKVRKIAPNGIISTILTGVTPLSSLTVDAANALYAGTYQGNIYKINTGNNTSTLLYKSVGTVASMKFDKNGVLNFVDDRQHKVLKVEMGYPGPPKPANLVSTAGNGQVVLTWDGVSDAKYYNVYRSLENDVKKLGFYRKINSPQTTFTDKDLTNGTTYYYAVCGQDASMVEGLKTDMISVTPVAPIPGPANFFAKPGNGSIDLSWAAVTDAVKYNIYRGTSVLNMSLLTSVNTLAYKDQGLQNNTNYYYTVTALTKDKETEASAQIIISPVNQLYVSAVAGNGSTGFKDGEGSAAQFNYPFGLAMNTAGQIMIVDDYNYRIRELKLGSKTVSTVAGSGTVGQADGLGTAASFFYPQGIAADKSGDFYITQSGGSLVRKMTASGEVSTFASNIGSGPIGIALDDTYLYVALSYDNQIVKIDRQTKVKTVLAGSTTSGLADGIGTSASFNYPSGLAVDNTTSAKFLYVADCFNHLIRKIDLATGAVSTYAGSVSGDMDGIGTAAKFNRPAGLATDVNGNLYVTEQYSHRIKRISPTGLVNTIVGNGSYGRQDGLANKASLGEPYGILVVSPDLIYITEFGNQGVRKIEAVTPPATPANLTATSGDSKVNLSWNPVKDATSYTISRGLSASGPFTTVSTDQAGTSFENRSLTNGTRYFYTVVANSPYGAGQPATADAVPLATPVITGLSDIFAHITDEAIALNPQSRSEGTISYESSNPAVATVVSGKVNFTGDGETTITATQAAAGGYTSATATFKVNVTSLPKPTIGDFIIATATYGDGPVSLKAPESNSTGDFTYSSSNTAIADIVNGQLIIRKAGTVTITAKQESDGKWASKIVSTQFTVSPKALTLALNTPATKVYNGTSQITISLKSFSEESGLVGSDQVSVYYQSASFEDAKAGEDKNILITNLVLTGANQANYTLNKFSPKGSITKKPISASPKTITKEYDGTDAAEVTFNTLTATNGRVGSDDVKVVYTSAAYADKNVTAETAVTIDGLALSGTAKDNYVLQPLELKGAITAKTITVTAKAASKVYGEEDPKELTYTNIPALLEGDKFSGTLSRVAGEKAGSYSIEQGSLVLNSNYTLKYTPADFTVNKALLTIIAEDKSKTYGEANPELTIKYEGFVNNETALSSAPSVSTTAKETSGVGVYDIVIDANSDNYQLNLVKGKLTVNKKALTVKVEDKSKVYGELNPAFTVKYEGLVNEETALSPAPSVTTTATKESAVDKYDITASGTSPNYDITFEKGTLTITKKALTVKVENKNKTYGEANPAFTVKYTGLANAETALKPAPTVSTEATEASGAGEYDITGSGTSSNYDITFEKGTLTIAKKALTIKVEDKNKTYGEANPELTIKYVGLVNNETAISPEPFVTTPATAASAVGVYDILASAASANYDISIEKGKLTVGKKALTIKVEDKNKTYGEVNPELTIKYEGLVNDEIALSPAPSVTTTAKTTTGVGEYDILASASSANYDISVEKGKLTIAKKALTVKVEDKSKIYGEVNPAFTLKYEGLVNNETALSPAPSVATTATKASGVGVYDILASGTAPNYDITFEKGTLTITKKALTVKVENKNKIYGEVNPALTVKYVGLANAETALSPAPSVNTEATEASGVGVYDILASGTAPNYDISFEKGTLTIAKKALTIKVDNKSKIYGDENPLFTVMYEGLVNNETALSPAPQLSTIATEISKVGSYDITASAVSDNYSISYVNAKLTVNKRLLTVKADDKEKYQNTPNPELTVSYSGFAKGESAADLLTLATASSEVVLNTPLGNYDIVASGASSNNYSFDYVLGSFDVKPGHPTSISLAASTVYENQAAGTLAGTLSSTSDDPSATFKYELVEGFGDNDFFKIVDEGTQLTTKEVLNFENKASYSIKVRSTTQHKLWLDKEFTINIVNVNEQPTLADIAPETICYNTAPQLVSLSGISAGPDAHQSTSLSISSSNNSLFEVLEVNQAINGQAELRYVVKKDASGSAVVNVLVTDDGGTVHGGLNSILKSFTITVNPLPVVTISSDKGNSISKGDELNLTATGGVSYHWSNAEGIIAGQNSATLTVRPSVTTTYRVTATNATNCSEVQEFTVTVNEDYQMVSGTNLVTPNGDGVNDNFVIKNLDMYPNNEVKIFDRAGRLLYSKKNYSSEWNGTFNGAPLAEDTYYYIVDFGSKKPALKGFITIVRD